MTSERLSEYAPELYDALKNVLEEIPAIAGDSRHDELWLRIQEAAKLIREIEESQDEENLKRCPFCGGKAELFGTETNGIFYVKCLECDVDSNFDTPEEAIAAWNRRAME